ncbi:hypothetical protein POVCU1_079960 [Plasmodium ovale curtisi]|uniref:PIR Superfamily Protein n=1 Tax=Plasmodium ovale curtisi TaxID=864141 RepID=A0A1A8XBZ3_PLAOA|nr:hypothetical protein POVCU1_079960 [Plasmodium ovale curtisi]
MSFISSEVSNFFKGALSYEEKTRKDGIGSIDFQYATGCNNFSDEFGISKVDLIDYCKKYYENIYSKVSHSYIKDTESACSEDNQKSIYEYENSITNCPNLDDDAKF